MTAPIPISWLARWLDRRGEETGTQAVRGLAESGYASALGTARLAESAAPYLNAGPGMLAGAGKGLEMVGRLAQPIEESRDEMREYYGEPTSTSGRIGQGVGQLVGTVAQMMAPSAIASRLGMIPASAPAIRRAATELVLGMPIDALQGAGVEPEESMVGLAGQLSGNKTLQGVAQSPWGRAGAEMAGGALLGGLAESTALLRGHELANAAKFVEVGPEDFDRAARAFAESKPDMAGFLTWRSPEEMKQEGMRLFLTPRGDAGFAIHPKTGDIRNVFTAPGAAPGTGAWAVANAVGERGGKILDAYDTKLTDIYRDMGFNETSRMPWDDAYRPEGWREDVFGKPDVLGMEYAGPKDMTPQELFDLYQERRGLRTGKPPIPTRPPTMAERFLRSVRNVMSDESGMAGLGIEDLRNLKNYLRPDESRIVTEGAAEKVIHAWRNLPSASHLTAAALAGRAKRGWYRNSAQAIVDTYGQDAPRFAALLAAMSPQTSVESNLKNAMNVWNAWVEAGGRAANLDEAGIKQIMAQAVERSDLSRLPMARIREFVRRAQKEFGVTVRPKGNSIGAWREALRTQLDSDQLMQLSVLPAWVPNAVRALTTDAPTAIMLSGPKVDSFMRNLLNDVDAVTLDTHMAKLAAMEQQLLSGGATKAHSGKTPTYVAYSARTREAARRLTNLTGQKWTPAEVQETAWSWAYALGEDIGGGAKTFKKTPGSLVSRAGDVTDEMVHRTPSFDELFHDPRYASILESGRLPLPTRAPAAERGLDVAEELVPPQHLLEDLATNMERHAAEDYRLRRPKPGEPGYKRGTAASEIVPGIQGPGGEAFRGPSHYGAVLEAEAAGKSPQKDPGWLAGYFSDLLGFLPRRHAYDLLTPAQRRIADEVLAEQGWPAGELTSEALGEIRMRSSRTRGTNRRLRANEAVLKQEEDAARRAAEIRARAR